MKKVFSWIVGIVLTMFVLCTGIMAYWYIGSDHYTMTGVPVLNYHQVNDRFNTCLTMTTQNFEKQMKYLQDNGYHAITQAQLRAYMETGADLPDKPIMITFDDGYIDNYECAYPIMKKYGMTGTIFVITSFVDSPQYLSWRQIDTMRRDGIEFGSHTVHHNPLDSLDQATMRQELTESKRILEKHLEREVPYIAYPEGKYNGMVKKETKAAGYAGAFTVNTGRIYSWDDAFVLDRVPLFEGLNSFDHFRIRLVFSTFCGFLWRAHDYVAKNLKWKHIASLIPQP